MWFEFDALGFGDPKEKGFVVGALEEGEGVVEEVGAPKTKGVWFVFGVLFEESLEDEAPKTKGVCCVV